MVLTVAVESLVKLLCFLIVGVFVCFFVFDGLGTLLTAAADAGFAQRFSIGSELGYADWFLLTLVSGLAFVVLPRQFQVAVIENPTPDNLRRAGWLLPIYFFVINLFVVPIAMAGLLAGLPVAEGDNFVLAIPLLAESHWVAMVAYLGGLSAATAMVIVETVALSTMISNDLAMPVLLRLRRLGRPENGDLGRMILNIRRGAILAVLVGGYLFFEIVGTRYALASIGLISFAGVAQVAPAIVAGLYWKDANRQGALAGLGAGVFVWLYTLVLPAFGGVGGVPADIATGGPFGIALLAPYALFGVQGLDPVPHALAWSLSVNAILLVAV
jgi:Na+/proline symporter